MHQIVEKRMKNMKSRKVLKKFTRNLLMKRKSQKNYNNELHLKSYRNLKKNVKFSKKKSGNAKRLSGNLVVI